MWNQIAAVCRKHELDCTSVPVILTHFSSGFSWISSKLTDCHQQTSSLKDFLKCWRYGSVTERLPQYRRMQKGMGHFQIKIPLSVVSKSVRLKITTIFNRKENDRFVDYEITESLLVLQVMLLAWEHVKWKAPITGGWGDARHKSTSWKMEREGWELTVHRSHSESLRSVWAAVGTVSKQIQEPTTTNPKIVQTEN